MSLSRQLAGLPLFLGLFKSCATCGTPFIPARPNLVHQKYHTHACWLVEHNRIRRERSHHNRIEPPPVQAPLPPVCHCGADLVRVESDWMTGATMEVCARGHRTNPVLRRRLAA